MKTSGREVVGPTLEHEEATPRLEEPSFHLQGSTFGHRERGAGSIASMPRWVQIR